MVSLDFIFQGEDKTFFFQELLHGILQVEVKLVDSGLEAQALGFKLALVLGDLLVQLERQTIDFFLHR